MKTTLSLLCLLVFAGASWGAISADAQWDVRSTGTDTNGGAFVFGASGTDMSQHSQANASGCMDCYSTSADLSSTSASADGTTSVTCPGCAFDANIVGNVVYIAGGSCTITAQHRQVTNYTGTTIALDAAIGAASCTGVTLNVGGAMLTAGVAASFATAGNTIHWKAGNYTMTTTIENVAGGQTYLATNVALIGYLNNHLDYLGGPTISASGIASAAVINTANASGDHVFMANITVDCAGLSGVEGFSYVGVGYMLQANNCASTAIYVNYRAGSCLGCGASNSRGLQAISVAVCIGCEAWNGTNNSEGAFSPTVGSTVVAFSAALNNSGTSIGYFNYSGGGNSVIMENNLFNNGGDGIKVRAGDGNYTLLNNVSENNGGWGVDAPGAAGILVGFQGCYNNTAGCIAPYILGAYDYSPGTVNYRSPRVCPAPTWYLTVTQLGERNYLVRDCLRRDLGDPNPERSQMER